MAQWIFVLLGGLAAIATLVTFFATGVGRAILEQVFPPIRLQWDYVLAQVSRAKHRVLILQTWLPGLREPGNQKAWRKALKRRHVKFRVLLLDQRLVPFRLRAREKRVSELAQNVSDLTELAESFNSGTDELKLEVRFYSCLPFGPIYVIDDDVYWGVYLADKDAMQGPAFHTRSDSPMGHFVLDSFEAAWANGSHSSGGLIVGRARHAPDAAPQHVKEVEASVQRLSTHLVPVTLEEFRRRPASGCLCLIRHADTDLNAAGIISGDLEVGINHEGFQEATALAAVLEREHWDSIYSSPLRRCLDTLRVIVAERVKDVSIRDELRERAMGDLEGYYKSSYAQSVPAYDGVDILESPHTKAVNGESFCNVFHRIEPFLDTIIEEVKAGRRVLVCSHEAPIRMMRMALENLPLGQAVDLPVGNCEPRIYVPAMSGRQVIS